jgi:hypothetical protein
MIAAYLKRLEAALADDPALAAQVLQEVRDHLEEALAADHSGDRCAAERRVIERFGDPRELAAQFAPVSLAQHTRRAGMAIMVATAMIMLMMKARVLWYGVVEWKLSEPVQALASRIIMVDRYAFWLAAGGAVASALYIARQPVPACLNAHYQKHVQRAAGLFILATIPLGISVTSDLALTILQLPTVLSPAALIPVISISVEIGCIIAAALMVGNAARRAARVEEDATPSG